MVTRCSSLCPGIHGCSPGSLSGHTVGEIKTQVVCFRKPHSHSAPRTPANQKSPQAGGDKRKATKPFLVPVKYPARCLDLVILELIFVQPFKLWTSLVSSLHYDWPKVHWAKSVKRCSPGKFSVHLHTTWQTTSDLCERQVYVLGRSLDVRNGTIACRSPVGTFKMFET